MLQREEAEGRGIVEQISRLSATVESGVSSVAETTSRAAQRTEDLATAARAVTSGLLPPASSF